MSTFIVRGGMVLDETRWASRDVVIRDGVVVSSGSGDVDAVIDAAGCWVLPVLTDAHCHLLPGHLRRLPLFGVGLAIDMFSTDDMRSRMDKEAADSGARYVTAGIGASVRGGHPYQLVTSGLFRDFPSVAEAGGAAAFVHDRVKSGSALVKVFLDDGRSAGQKLPTLNSKILAELVEEAHGRGLPVVAHAPTADLALRAIATGVDGLAHMPVPDGQEDAAELAAAAAEQDVFIVSTLVATAAALGVPQLGSLPESPLWERVPHSWRQHLTRTGRSDPDHASLDRLLALVGTAHRAGVLLLPGTDAAFPGVMPGASLHTELEVLYQCGVPGDELLASVTSGMRKKLGLLGGGILPGDRAELLVLSRDPRASVTATRHIEHVVLGDIVLRFPGFNRIESAHQSSAPSTR